MNKMTKTYRRAEGKRSSMKTFQIMAAAMLVLLMVSHPVFATSSSTFWTPMTLDFPPYGVCHLGIDNYCRVTGASPDGAFATDMTSPTVGVLPFSKIQMEVGFDYFANTPHPWLFNAKIGAPEDAWFKGQPAIEVGTFLLGRKAGTARADYDIVYGVVGKTLGPIGRLSIGPYVGNHATLVSSSGKSANAGYMVAFDHGFGPVKDASGAVDYNRFVFAADYASGKNFIGGGGGGIYIFFKKNISLLVGPTFFNDQGINGKWKLSTQLDINLPKLFGKRK
jgi:hypothetical protein